MPSSSNGSDNDRGEISPSEREAIRKRSDGSRENMSPADVVARLSG